MNETECVRCGQQLDELNDCPNCDLQPRKPMPASLTTPLRAEPIVATISKLSTNYGRLLGLAMGFKMELERNPTAEDRERRIRAIQETIDECEQCPIKETAALIVAMSEDAKRLVCPHCNSVIYENRN